MIYFKPEQAIYGHSSPETALVVPDYPYGSLRCEMRYWLETVPGKGDRFCARTTNPKNGRINAPKKSTYQRLGVMYLDEKGHCQWAGVSHYAGPDVRAAFVAAVDRSRLQPVQQAVYDRIAEGLPKAAAIPAEQ